MYQNLACIENKFTFWILLFSCCTPERHKTKTIWCKLLKARFWTKNMIKKTQNFEICVISIINCAKNKEIIYILNNIENTLTFHNWMIENNMLNIVWNLQYVGYKWHTQHWNYCKKNLPAQRIRNSEVGNKSVSFKTPNLLFQGFLPSIIW